MSSNINTSNSYRPSVGFILLASTLLLSAGIVYWSFSPNNIEVFMQLAEQGDLHVKREEYQQATDIYSQAAHLHHHSPIKAHFFLAAANNANLAGNLKKATNNLYLCFVNYPLLKDSHRLLLELIPKIQSDTDVANFINKIQAIDNFPLVEVIKSANLRLALINKDNNKKQFKALLNQSIQNELEQGPKPVFTNKNEQ